ncbi:hypothetical protein NL676_009180 [Syzygium grande]|nr:hypothetical protein NL676_009180 [Syzygium grande]
MTVQDSFIVENLNCMLDSTAGHWPFEQARKLAHLALRCCHINPSNRPELKSEVWPNCADEFLHIFLPLKVLPSHMLKQELHQERAGISRILGKDQEKLVLDIVLFRSVPPW